MKKIAYDWAALILGLFFGVLLINFLLANFVVKTEEIAFGTDTTGYLGGVGDTTMHCMDAIDSSNCLDSYRASGQPPAVLWLGNSQLPGINKYSVGQQNAPQILHRSLLERDHYLMAFSQPNANLLEHALVLEALAPKLDLKLLLFPVVFDDIREFGIRKNVADFTVDVEVAKNVSASPVFPFLSDLLTLEPGSGDGDIKVVENPTFQSRSEEYLVSWLDQNSTLWASRSALRGTLASAIHHLRNKLLGIHSYTKRSVDSVIYRERMKLLEKMLQNIKLEGVEVLLYVPPYRDDIDGPYIETQYSDFKKDLQEMAQRIEVEFVNLEGIVPGVEWATVTERIFGFKEPDFMHFTAAGHEKLAAELDKQIRSMGY